MFDDMFRVVKASAVKQIVFNGKINTRLKYRVQETRNINHKRVQSGTIRSNRGSWSNPK